MNTKDDDDSLSSSIDSFVRDTPSSSLRIPENPSSVAYLSPSSAEQIPKIPHVHSQSSDRASFTSQDSSLLPVPATPFFSYYEQQPQQDPTLSDGSLILKKSNKGQQHHHARRDRLPSYDSVGSSGSLIRVAPTANPVPNNIRPATVTTTLPAYNNAAIANMPKILPYHERRKRQQQQQQQYQSSSSPQYMPPPQEFYPPFPPQQYPPPPPPPPTYQPQQLYPPTYYPPPPQIFMYPPPPPPPNNSIPHLVMSSPRHNERRTVPPPPRPQNPTRSNESLPPPPVQLIRQDSSGSISSLGSQEGNQRLQEYHRKNQEFLKQQSPASSPVATPRAARVSRDRPPASRGTHRRLPSIEHDDWGENQHHNEETSSYFSSESSDECTDDEEANERTRLLPPTGISSNENNDKSYTESPHRKASRKGRGESSKYVDKATAAAMLEYQMRQARRQHRKKKKKRRSNRHQETHDDVRQTQSSSSQSSREYEQWMKKRARMLEKERAKLIQQWREEDKAQEGQVNKNEDEWQSRGGHHFNARYGGAMDRSFKLLTWSESFIANLPLTIGAIALAFANLGVVWFKFAEENMDSCQPVHFHSSQCTFPEFPGCFYCDTHAKIYRIALSFHLSCSTFAGMLAFMFIAKLMIASRVVFDELSSPTTATPAGLICMTLDIVFAGRGFLGQVIVTTSACIHLCLAIWFIYMALAYHIMPEPSWFPNTVSIGISAVKAWLYYPTFGHFLMAISLSLNFLFFPISLFRVAVNRKISATVGWMQMSAPNVSLYALTLMAQPSFEEEHPDINRFQKMHRVIYLPCMHFFFGLCILGMVASVHSLLVRWSDFRKYRFSPAHAAFCVPALSHVNAIQAYRAAVNSFSNLPHGHPFRVALYIYWVVTLIAGTIVTLWIGFRFLIKLPEWTHIDTEGELEPPAPYETAMQTSNLLAAGETLVQPFVSPAILQANETGALVMSRNEAGNTVYRRTRQVTALGFEPIMSDIQMDVERELLLDWVGKNPPRRRHRTLSVPGIDFNYGSADFGIGNNGVYGINDDTQRRETSARSSSTSNRSRANTSSPYVGSSRKQYK